MNDDYDHDLYGGMPPHVAGSDTSLAAALEIAKHAPTMQQKILALIAQFPKGLICEEVEVTLGYKHQSASARIRESVQQGKLIASEQRRKSSAGSDQVVYLRTDVPADAQGKKAPKTPKTSQPPTLADPSKADVLEHQNYFRQLRKELAAVGKKLPEGVVRYCVWSGLKFDIPPEAP